MECQKKDPTYLALLRSSLSLSYMAQAKDESIEKKKIEKEITQKKQQS